MVEIFKNATDTLFPPTSIPVTTTIPAEPSGPFNALGSFFSKIGPMLPWILGIAFLGILIFLGWSFLNKKGKLFQKDYAKESYKEKVRFYSRNPTRVSSSKWGWSFFLETLVLAISIITGVLLFGMGWVAKFPTFWVILVPVIFLVLLIIFNLSTPTVWVSYPKAVNSRGELLGWMLSIPTESPDGFLETLIFKKTKWLLFKQVDILSVPILSEFSFPEKDNKTGRTGIRKFTIKEAKENRYSILGNGDLLVNSSAFFGTRFHIYPNFSDSSKTFDLRDIIFLKEKKDGDLLNLTDLANEFRENSVILAGGNPHNRISGEGSNPKKDNFEGE